MIDKSQNKGGLFGDLSKIGSSLLSGSLGALKDAADKAKELTLSQQEKERLEKQR